MKSIQPKTPAPAAFEVEDQITATQALQWANAGHALHWIGDFQMLLKLSLHKRLVGMWQDQRSDIPIDQATAMGQMKHGLVVRLTTVVGQGFQG